MKQRYTAALCQMNTQTCREENLQQAAQLVRQAAAQGASLAAFPEVFNVIDRGDAPPEVIPDGPSVSRMAALAREYQMWILCGSLQEAASGEGKRKNTSVLLNPQGEVAARYSKLHLFDVTLPDGSTAWESEVVQPGDRPVLADTELGRMGLSICYDLRFPELYRLYALQGAQLLLVPAEFNRDTGRLHWETLLRARAIENGCYVIAPGQVGMKDTKDGPYPCYGNSMIIAPNGQILVRGDENEVGVFTAEIDLSQVERVRQQIPALKNRRRDVYSINGM